MYKCTCGATFESEQAYTIHTIFCRGRYAVTVAIAIILMSLASGSAEAQIILPNPPHCNPCPPVVYLPIVHNAPIVDAATRFWGG